MKKTLLLAVIAAALGAGCASTSGTQATTANQTMTLEQALEKSAETRQKLLDAKQSYQDAKNAADVASGKKNRRGRSQRTTPAKSRRNQGQTPGRKRSLAGADELILTFVQANNSPGVSTRGVSLNKLPAI